MSRNGCGWECCPSGFFEHVKNYRYLKDVAGVGLVEYWWHEIKGLLGLNYADEDEFVHWWNEEMDDERKIVQGEDNE